MASNSGILEVPYKYRSRFIDLLKRKRKVAVRLGSLSSTANWVIKPDVTKELLKGNIDTKSLSENDVIYEVRQKGVDMRIGLDIASLAYKQQVGRIVLVSGDNDFVPAAKLARREGIDFILDPMYQKVSDELNEHVDGINSTWSVSSH